MLITLQSIFYHNASEITTEYEQILQKQQLWCRFWPSPEKASRTVHLWKGNSGGLFAYKALLQAIWACDIDDPQAATAGIVHGIGRAAGGFRQIANADAAVIHKMPIAFLHTAPKIVLRGVSHLICAALDFFVGVDIRLWPAPSLVKARQYKDQPDLRITLPQAEDNLRCQSIKSQGTTCAEIAIALLDQRGQGILQALGNFGQIICRQLPMSGETSRSGFHVYHLITTTYQYNNIHKPSSQHNCSL